jgi:hypothetical protein
VRRPLPASDDAIARLSDDDREAIAEVWLGRAAMERRVGDSFAVVTDALRALRADGEALRLAERAIDDEMRHAEICRFVASRFHGAELASPPRLALTVPKLPGASDELRHTLHVVGQCALNETTASAVLEASVDGARSDLARAALRELLSDEIDHARIGWMHLAQVRAPIRADVERLLLPLVRANMKTWRDSPRPTPPANGLDHGAPPYEVIERALLGSVRDLIVPGVRRLGMKTAPVEEWLAEGAPTS